MRKLQRRAKAVLALVLVVSLTIGSSQVVYATSAQNKKSEAEKNLNDVNKKIDLQTNKVAKKVVLGYLINKPWFEYNEKDGQYYRFQYGKKHIDDQNKKQLHCSNIIVQFVNYKLYPDNKSLDITLNGTGKGWFITNGKAEKITWKKDKQKTGQTKYMDQSGQEIKLNTGKTWICILGNNEKSNFKIKKK